MMFKTNDKELIKGCGVVFSCGYCKLQRLLSCRQPIAYHATRMYGWRYNVYQLSPAVWLTTGYEYCKGAIDIDSIADKYEERALQCETQEELDKLLDEFAQELFELRMQAFAQAIKEKDK